MRNLRTGHPAMPAVVMATTITLRTLLEEEPLVLYDAVMIAREPYHQPFANNGSRLEEFGLLQNGTMREDIRQIILASTQGDDLQMHLVFPYAQEEGSQ